MIFCSSIVWADQSIPEILRRPDRGEAPRYPIDVVIGSLGRGSAPEGAYNYALNLLSAMVAGNTANAGQVLTREIMGEVTSLRPRSYRLGGGRTEADGFVSFLIRLLSQNESITGELFIRLEEDGWILDGIILEDRQDISSIQGGARFDFSPYERFY